MKKVLFLSLVLALALVGCRGMFPFLLGGLTGALVMHEVDRPRTVIVQQAPPQGPPSDIGPDSDSTQSPPVGYEAYPDYPGYYYYPYSPYPLFWYGGYFYGYYGGYWHGRYGYRGHWGVPHHMPGSMRGFHRGYSPRGGGGHGGGHGGGGHGGGGHGGGHGGHR